MVSTKSDRFSVIFHPRWFSLSPIYVGPDLSKLHASFGNLLQLQVNTVGLGHAFFGCIPTMVYIGRIGPRSRVASFIIMQWVMITDRENPTLFTLLLSSLLWSFKAEARSHVLLLQRCFVCSLFYWIPYSYVFCRFLFCSKMAQLWRDEVSEVQRLHPIVESSADFRVLLNVANFYRSFQKPGLSRPKETLFCW